MKKSFCILCTLFFIHCSLLYSYDWGLRLNQSLDVEGVGTETVELPDDLSYMGTLIPWLSMPLGADYSSNKDLYLAAGMSVEYRDASVFFIPELLRTELTWRLGEGRELRFGRMNYTDPLGFIANGLFDGARFSFDQKNNSFGAGVWYTGLLYKRNANVTMTSLDQASYIEALDYSNFADTYFAPRRLVAAFDWENPYLAPWLRMKAAILGQVDLTGRDELFHSQYLAFKASFLVQDFVFDLGGCFALAELSSDDSTEVKASFAGELGAGWTPPTQMKDLLKLTFRFSNGTVEDGSFAAFVPITAESQGDVLRAKLSGLSMIRLEYIARVYENFSFSAASSYFILSDLGTYKGLPDGRDGYFLGNEFSGRMIWSPFSDLQLNLGGGVFLPSMGNSGSKSSPVWRVELYAALAIF